MMLVVARASGEKTRGTTRGVEEDAAHWPVVGPADVAALALHIMANGALAGATYDIDGASSSSHTDRPLPSARAAIGR
jgi:hypothetical protein